MRQASLVSLLALTVGLAACGSAERPESLRAEPSAPGGAANANMSATAPPASSGGGGGGERAASRDMKQVSLDETEASKPVERKVIRNGDLELECSDPLEGQKKLVSIAESSGGFVVTSESRQLDEKRVTVTATLRVPAEQFDKIVEAIRAVGDRVLREKVTGQDVTEEYVDVQARIKSMQAVEAQYLEVMKRAESVKDVLEVQEKLGDIRAQIEQLQGRLRFLENQTTLSTISVTLSPPAPLVSSSGTGFFAEIRRALGNTVDVFLGIITGLVWFLSYFIPAAVILGIPGYFVLRFLWRALTRGVGKPAPPT